MAGARRDEYGPQCGGSLESCVLRCCRHTQTWGTLAAANKPATVFADVLEKLNHVADGLELRDKAGWPPSGRQSGHAGKRIM